MWSDLKLISGKYKNTAEILVALAIITGLFFFLGMDDIIFSGPFGIHFMRQTDSLSFAGIYFREGFEFFNPGLYNLKNIDGHAACEFPVLYYITSLIYLVTGQNYSVLKILNYLLAMTGIFCIYRMSMLILRNRLYSILIALVLFTSTVFNYYSLNYLPDSGAFGLIMIGWFFFFRYYYSTKKGNLYFSFLLFTLGSLVKVTYLINPLSVLVLYLVLPFIKKGSHKANIHYPVIISGVITVIMVAAWNIYIISYNRAYESTSFNTTAMPIWNISREEISIVWDHFTNYWYRSYFSRNIFHLIFMAAVFQIIFIKKSNTVLSLLTLIMFIGSLSFFFLFYSQFKDHDYYFITFFPLAIFILINAVITFKNLKLLPVYDIVTRIIILIIILTGINYSRQKLKMRYDNAMDDYSRTGLIIQANKPDLDSLCISQDARVIVAPDLTQNGGLLMLDRMGWNIERPEQISIEKIESLIKQGAEYLFLVSKDEEVIEKGNETGNLIYKDVRISIFELGKESGER